MQERRMPNRSNCRRYR
ncbi:hypothetical protein Gogos_019845 [Gossypium gossypioides]|uniref:Uncharacterized protein n=1 Tax=Gossypium gossypioides TaxID=34282 RepID=A0A7J9D262_GOSGO|nr:hypothetical protein [Gossypium gossypioides]